MRGKFVKASLSTLVGGPLTAVRVAELSGLPIGQVRNALSGSVRYGSVQAFTRGNGHTSTYAITAKGLALLAPRPPKAKPVRDYPLRFRGREMQVHQTTGWPTVPPADLADRVLASACNKAGGFSRFSERPLGVEPRTGKPKWACCLPLVRGEAA